MDKGSVIIKTNIKALLDNLFKRILVVLFVFVLCVASYKVKNSVAKNYNIKDSIFNSSDPLGTITMIFVYIIIGILLILLIVALYKFFSVFYALKRVTIIDFIKEKIVIQSYDFPFEKQIEEKRFNSIVGVDIEQKSIDRIVNCGTLYLEYLVLSKNDSKLRGIEIPNVLNPVKLKDKLMNE